jgi:hypothetical protein
MCLRLTSIPKIHGMIIREAYNIHILGRLSYGIWQKTKSQRRVVRCNTWTFRNRPFQIPHAQVVPGKQWRNALPHIRIPFLRKRTPYPTIKHHVANKQHVSRSWDIYRFRWDKQSANALKGTWQPRTRRKILNLLWRKRNQCKEKRSSKDCECQQDKKFYNTLPHVPPTQG